MSKAGPAVGPLHEIPAGGFHRFYACGMGAQDRKNKGMDCADKIMYNNSYHAEGRSMSGTEETVVQR